MSHRHVQFVLVIVISLLGLLVSVSAQDGPVVNPTAVPTATNTATPISVRILPTDAATATPTPTVTPSPTPMPTLAPSTPRPTLAVTSGALMGGVTLTPTLHPQNSPARRALVISLDAARPDAILSHAPFIRRFAENRGAYDWEARTVFPPQAVPAHVSLLTGLTPDEHGIRGDYGYGTDISQPTLLTLADEAGLRVGVVVSKSRFDFLRQTESMDLIRTRQKDNETIEQVVNMMDAGYDLVFAHLSELDYAGHLATWMGQGYLGEIETTDSDLQAAFQDMEARGLFEDTLIIITSGHGGHDYGHGEDIPEDMLIPWVAVGPGIPPGSNLQGVQITDTAAFVLWSLGIDPDPGMEQALVRVFADLQAAQAP